MASMDPYLSYLKARVAEVKRKRPNSEWHFAEAEFNRALDFARRNDLTESYLTPEAAKAKREHEEEVALELWVQQNLDDEEWARRVWPELTFPADEWSPSALECLEEARNLIAEGKN